MERALALKCTVESMLSHLLLIVTNGQNSQKFQTSSYKMLRNYLCDV